MAKYTLKILRLTPQDFKSMFGHSTTLSMKGLTIVTQLSIFDIYRSPDYGSLYNNQLI